MTNHEYWMRQAIELAGRAEALGEVPVGALVVADGNILGEGFNQPITLHDPSAHAEMQALRQAALAQENYRLPGATLYVTIEPCTMCFGAMIHARIEHLVFGANEPKAGVIHSADAFGEKAFFNHRLQVTANVLADECSQMMSDFFQRRRAEIKAQKNPSQQKPS